MNGLIYSTCINESFNLAVNTLHHRLLFSEVIIFNQSSFDTILKALPKVRTAWPAGPWPDQSFRHWNRLFLRVFAETPSPSCTLFWNWLICLDNFLKVKFSLCPHDGNGVPGRSVLTNGNYPKISFNVA